MAIDESCSTQSVLPRTLVIILMAIYWGLVFIASIRSFIQLKNEDDNFKKLGCFGKMKRWAKDTWRRKKCYLELFPHITDTATDIGVLIEFYQIAEKQEKYGRNIICSSLNMKGIFYVSVGIILLYRIASSLQIWFFTKSIRQTIFQFFDIEIFHALIINYKTKKEGDEKDEPCQPQKWISYMEATFESVPQSWIQLIYLISSGIFFNEFGIVQISFIWSLFVIVLRNSNEDKRSFENAMSDRLKSRLKANNITKDEWKNVPSKYLLLFPFRFCDIFCRIVILTISYVFLKWYQFASINIFEILILIIISVKTKRWDRLNHFIRTELSINYINARIVINSIWILWIYFAFKHELIDSDVATLILIIICMLCVLCLAVLFYLIYKKMKWFKEMNFKFFNDLDIFHASRNIKDLIKSHHWNDILDLITFGFDTTPNKLLEKHPDLLEVVSEDFKTGQAFLNYLMGGVELDIEKFRDIWSGTLQAFENKDDELDDIKEKKKDEKKMKKKRKALQEEFDRIIDFLQKLLSNNMIKDDTNNLEMLLNSRTTYNHRTVLHILTLKRIGKDFLDDLCENDHINPNIPDKYNETPLHIATKTKEDNQSISITQSLLNNKKIEINITNKSRSNETPLHYSMKSQSSTLCHIFLNNNKLNINQLTSYGDTYLHFSTKLQNEDIALMVVNKDEHQIPDINAKDYNGGDTALHLAMSKQRLFEKLVTGFRDKIDINIHNKQGVVPLMNASEYTDNNRNLDLLLIEASLEINAVDNVGNSALHRITCMNDTKTNFTKLLNHNQIDVNLLNNSGGYAPLHIAYANDNDHDNAMYQKMELLLNHPNINVNLQTSQSGDTALHFGVQLSLWWRRQRRDKLILLLCQPNIITNISNNLRRTPSSICSGQISEWKRKLAAAQQALERERRELEKYERIYQQKKREYDEEFARYSRVENEYNLVKSEYEREYDEWRAEKDEYDRAEPDIQRNMKRPGSQPSDYKVRNMKSKLDSAKRALDEKERKMQDAKNDRDRQQSKVDQAIRWVNECQQNLNASNEIHTILKQYIQ